MKLTPEQVRAIWLDPRQYSVIAKQYSVSRSLIEKIKIGVAHLSITGGAASIRNRPGRRKRAA